MTISKERLIEIALELAQETDILAEEAKNFALALIRRIEAESPKIKPEGFYNCGSEYLRLPLVSEE